MSPREIAERIVASRAALYPDGRPAVPRAKAEAEGGCGVVGVACAEPIAGRHLLRALEQMRNRGNGKGGGVAAVGLVPEDLGLPREVVERDVCLAVAYLDPDVRAEVERAHVAPVFEVDATRDFAPRWTPPGGWEVAPPDVRLYFVRPRPDALDAFRRERGLDGLPERAVRDELVFQNSFRLNRTFYAKGPQRAFVLSHGVNLLVWKIVGYGDDVVRAYGLEDLRAHVWIGHHRYPTKGRVWHPGGAHPFVGLHEALVHNGDFANYSAICDVLAQRNLQPLFLTDTEVSALLFDLLHRTYGYPLEYVIEALAPTTERDFALLPPSRRRIYAMLQATHIHGSPDGPWFFLIAQSVPEPRTYRLIGITDTSMLRPQVFALQEGPVPVGCSASEKQAIDAVFASLAEEDPRFWARPDRVWSARGGSHTDGGAFLFEVRPAADGAQAAFRCTDKFGRPVTACTTKPPPRRARDAAGGNGTGEGGRAGRHPVPSPAPASGPEPEGGGRTRGTPGPAEVARRALDSTPPDGTRDVLGRLPEWDEEDAELFLEALVAGAQDDARRARALETLTVLLDRRYPTGGLRRSAWCAALERALARWVDDVARSPGAYLYASADRRPAGPLGDRTVVLDARGFASEGPASLALEIVRLYGLGARRLVVVHCRGHRFIGNGLGPGTRGVRIDVYGSSGDYLASGIDGAEIVVHGSGQDQLAQIMKDGTLVVHGDVGQTFMYAAKGGRAFVLGNAAGRPLINAVGRPRVVINGTCLDYLAESFMAGDPLRGGGFAILNGIAFDEDGGIVDLDTPYPGGNLFSLASGGALYVRDPHRVLTEDQLNGGEFAELTPADWAHIRPYLVENERLFGIPLDRLLEVDGRPRPPERVYRKVRPGRVRALLPEEEWVKARV